MGRFLHLSDLHIRTSMTKDENVNCKKVVEFITREYDPKVTTILITGDIVDDGYQAQYENAVSLLTPLVEKSFRLLVSPGNHDYGKWGNFYQEDARKRFYEYILRNLLGLTLELDAQGHPKNLYPRADVIDGVVFIGADSVYGNWNDEALHFASGEIGASQRGEIQRLLDKHKGKPIVTHFHHHPFDRRTTMELDDADRVMRLLAGKTDFLCFGHDHVSDAWTAHNGIDRVLASGKTTDLNKQKKLEFRECEIAADWSSVSLITFKT